MSELLRPENILPCVSHAPMRARCAWRAQRPHKPLWAPMVARRAGFNTSGRCDVDLRVLRVLQVLRDQPSLREAVEVAV